MYSDNSERLFILSLYNRLLVLKNSVFKTWHESCLYIKRERKEEFQWTLDLLLGKWRMC